VYSDKLHIITIREPYIPNAFSPNKDGINDVFTFYFDRESLTKEIIIQEFVLYDRWGNLIRSITEQKMTENLEIWDGKFKQKDASPGLYFYNLTFLYPDFSTTTLKGEITLTN